MVLRGAVAFLGVVLLLCCPAIAEKRVALVIGNSAYQHTSKLTNPKNDATDITAELKNLAFTVIEGYDLDKTAFDRKVREFALALKGADAGVLFYAGHGLQVAGVNYLVPIDAKAEDATALEFEMLRVATIHRIMEQQTGTNILFLDACRDNPLARNLAREMGTRSAEIGKGLARIESGVGTLISFSTQPGNVALDGTGRNSPFAGALVKQLAAASTDDLSAMLIAVRNEVMAATKKRQVPWENSALTGRFYFSNPSTTLSPSKIKRSPEHPFDGYWTVTAINGAGCDTKGWTNRITVISSIIYFADKKAGGVDRVGSFSYSRLNSNYPNLSLKLSGKLSVDAGQGSYTTGRCAGTLKLMRES
jgi:hypothetical protein